MSNVILNISNGSTFAWLTVARFQKGRTRTSLRIIGLIHSGLQDYFGTRIVFYRRSLSGLYLTYSISIRLLSISCFVDCKWLFYVGWLNLDCMTIVVNSSFAFIDNNLFLTKLYIFRFKCHFKR